MRPKARRRPWWRRAALVLLRAAVVAVALSVVMVVALRWVPPVTSAFMIQRVAGAWGAGEWGFDLQYAWVPWDEIAPVVPLAVVAAEDQRFAEHAGFDVESIADAWSEGRRSGRLRGASTITQQVAKNLFLWPGRSFLRKGIEAYFAALLELLWPKRRILEVYVNVAEFGPGVFGVGAASARTFRKAPADLTAPEAALLAAVLPNPHRLNASRPSSYVRERQAWILRQMEQLGGVAYVSQF